MKNGSVNLIEVDTKAPVTPGEAISEGVKVKVIGNADYGYELASVKVEGANYNEELMAHLWLGPEMLR